jgi:hypothetical protein
MILFWVRKCQQVTVAQACNPSYSGGEEYFKASLGRKFTRLLLNQKEKKKGTGHGGI